ncbi:hypothetical protein DPEC_G00154960 [Dallia pectoralis]|uniref:Uncharacterized protein n=1 Tax=Dallia pectoralis TaxID=75939 RepID=A0ACC2GK81_DALPE|nr:hypothetical protein DPEC_G00154960 [Dallia pectoralis]
MSHQLGAERKSAPTPPSPKRRKDVAALGAYPFGRRLSAVTLERPGLTQIKRAPGMGLDVWLEVHVAYAL